MTLTDAIITEAIKILEAKVQCMRRRNSEQDDNHCRIWPHCHLCELWYEQGAMGEQIEALELAVNVLKQLPTQMSGASANNSEIQNSSNELISRQEVLTAIRTSNLSAATVYGRSERGMAVAKELVRLINGIPAFQEKQKTGHWIKRTILSNENESGNIPYTLDIYDCSKCGYPVLGNQTKFCPHCGAKMEEKTNGDV